MTAPTKNGRPRAPRVSPEILDSAPPEAAEAERGLIGWMVFNSEFPSEAAEIGPWHFRDPVKGRIWKHALELHTAGIEIRPTTLAPHFKDGEFPADALYSWSQEAPTLRPTLAHYIKQILAAANRRRARHLGEELLRQSADASFDPENFRIQFDEAFLERQAADSTLNYPALSCAELMGMNIITRYLIARILVEGQPLIIAGPKKALKTTLIIALALALATGKPFLGFFEVFAVVAVGIMTGESGMATIKETIQRIAYAMGIDPTTIENIFISEKVPQLDSVAHLEALRRFIVEHGLKILILDPAYMMMSGADAGNLFVQGQLLRGITELCQELGCTLIICHHTRKNIGRADQYGSPELEDVSWSGFQEWARQWVLVARREAYQPGTGFHALWMTSGGSAGHGGLWALNISEGTNESDGGRYWKVDVLSADDARKQVTSKQEAKRQQVNQENLEADKKRLIGTIAKYPEGETKSTIRDRSGIRFSRFNIALAALLEDGFIVECEIQKSNRKRPYEGYKLKESNPL